MLRPSSVQSALQTLVETDGVPADTALIIFSDSGLIYSQAHCVEEEEDDDYDEMDKNPIASTSTLPKQLLNESQRLQFARQPGLRSLLLGSGSSSSAVAPPRRDNEQILEKGESSSSTGAGTTTAGTALSLPLDPDERSKILAATACQSWSEETNRVKRLFSKIHGHTPGPISDSSAMMRSFSNSTGGGGGGASGTNGNGRSKLRRIEQNGLSRIDGSLQGSEILDAAGGQQQDADQETVEAPVAVPGTLLPPTTGDKDGTSSYAPLLLEGELGALLVLPLQHKTITSTPPSPQLHNSPTLLLVLAARPPEDAPNFSSNKGASVKNGESILSQLEWKNLHDAARAFASHVAPALRKAFGREGGTPGAREAMGDAVTVSDMESSAADFDGVNTVAGLDNTPSHGVGVGISVR